MLADARIASPNRVRVRKAPSATTSNGTMKMTDVCRASMRRLLVGSQTNDTAVGIALKSLMSGIQATRASSRICPTPIVAINKTSRGDENRRRTTRSSISAPTTAEPTTARTNAAHQGTS